MTNASSACARGRCLCGCCLGLTAATPVEVFNRPGLPAIAYRIGTQPSFKRSMLAALSRYPALAGLGTRADDDVSIALLDAWATVADVLTFYQERLANESFLPTATERFSLLELARLIGYELRPGVSASGYVTFTLAGGTASPPRLSLAGGIKVQSVPGPDEKPQTYETSAEIEARAAWNSLTPQRTARQVLDRTTRQLYLQGTATQLQPGDAILIVGAEREGYLGSEAWDCRLLESVQPDNDADRTLITWRPPLGTDQPNVVEPSQLGTRLYALRQRAALFGHNAPDPRILNLQGPLVGQVVDANGKWNGYELDPDVIDLDVVYPKIVAGSWIVLASPTYSEVCRVQEITSVSRSDFAISAKVTRIIPDQLETASAFELQTTTVFAQSEELTIVERPLREPVYGKVVALNELAPDLKPGQPLAFTGKRQRLRITPEARNLQIDSGDAQVNLAAGDLVHVLAPPVRSVAGALVPISPEELVAALDAATPVALIWQVRDANGFAGVLATDSDEIMLATAGNDDGAVSEIAFIDTAIGAVGLDDGRTVIHLDDDIENCFERASLIINANTAPVSHGETVREVLGSGDASQIYQRFTLKQQPLTYVGVSTASGARSTLKVRVNDLLWEEVTTLFGRGPHDRVYVTHPLDDGKTIVEFGDGITGARLPTGRENIRAEYRKGIGLTGLVKAGQLSQLMSAPLGVQGAINPEATAGADDRESLADARDNAPLTVLTLDRAVSLRDYEDFARAFSGVAKAFATWSWDGRERRVLITISGPQGAEIDDSSMTYKNLLGALANSGDPFVSFTLKSFRPATFRVVARIKVDEPKYERAAVHAAVTSALRNRFSFAARSFAQPVVLSEVIATIQDVPGVIAVDVDKLYRGLTPDLKSRLPADRPRVDAFGVLQAAELLTLDPGPLALEVMP